MQEGNFSHSQGQGSESCEILPHARSIDSHRTTEAIVGFHNKNPWDLFQSVTESEVSISSEGLGHVAPNLGYSVKSAKCSPFSRIMNEQW